MKNLDEFSESIKIEILRLFLTSDDWSHRRLQKDILGIEAPTAGGGFVAMSILRSFGLLDDSLKGIFSKISAAEDLTSALTSSKVPESTILLIENLFHSNPKRPQTSKRTFLLTWNPVAFPWDSFRSELEHFENNGSLILPWGCGNRKDIQVGDRLFFIKLGNELPRGIMGSGYAVSKSYEDKHWSGINGKLARYVDISFDVLLDFQNNSESLIAMDTLNSDSSLKTKRWSVQSSGTIIESPADTKLEELWRSNFISQIAKFFKYNPSNRKEGKQIEVISKTYERDNTTRDECIKLYGPICLACGLDFEKKYGPIGKGFIHVHHVIPLANRGGEYVPDASKDLIPLCPNCHAMIHKLDPPHDLEKLKDLLRIYAANI